MHKYYPLPIVSSDEPLLLQMLKQGLQAIPETFHAIDDDALGVIRQCPFGCHGEHLVEGADAAGEGDHHVAAVEHEGLALCQGVAGDALVVDGGGMTAALYPRWQHADDTTAGSLYGFCHTAHQSQVGAAIDQCMAVGAHPLAQLAGEGKKVGVDIAVGGTEDADVHGAIFCLPSG